MKTFFIDFIERHPGAGYIGAAVPTASGFWVLIEQATKIGALLSIAVGLAVGLVTYRVQRKNERLADSELARQRREVSRSRDRSLD